MLLIADYCVMGDKALWTRVLVLAPTLYWDDYPPMTTLFTVEAKLSVR